MRDLTTGQVARLCRFSQQHVIRCIDKGLLKCYRLPGSRFRRVEMGSLRAFMEAHGIPTDALGRDIGETRTVRVDQAHIQEPRDTYELVDGSTVSG